MNSGSITSLAVEGWREINHSYALVNQFQLLSLVRRGDVSVSHVDAPFHFSNWNKNQNGAGFRQEDEALLTGLKTAGPSDPVDCLYRIFSPFDLRLSANARRLVVFLVTELGIDADSFVAGSDLKAFEASGGLVVTPSNWARDRIIDFGFKPESLVVVPHGASPDYFKPLPETLRRAQRTALGFRDDETLLLNIGTAIWTKGIDVLLKAFAITRQQRKDVRLIFKDQRNTYGIQGDTYVQQTLANAGLLTPDVMGAITLIPANLTMEQMCSIYGLADWYVSPYRAEGFNLPVCEALACGTPVVVTKGGATDDFVPVHGQKFIDANLNLNATIQGEHVSGYLEPSLEHLVSIMSDLKPKAAGPIHAFPTWTWDKVAESLVSRIR